MVDVVVVVVVAVIVVAVFVVVVADTLNDYLYSYFNERCNGLFLPSRLKQYFVIQLLIFLLMNLTF